MSEHKAQVGRVHDTATVTSTPEDREFWAARARRWRRQQEQEQELLLIDDTARHSGRSRARGIVSWWRS